MVIYNKDTSNPDNIEIMEHAKGPLSSHAVLSDRCRDYQQAINQIEDYFEYRYLGNDSTEIKKTVMDIIDNLVIQIAKSGHVV